VAWEVRPTANVEEFTDAVGAISHYFGSPRDLERAERFSRVLPLERMHAAVDDGRIVGGAGAFPFQLSVPGAVVPCGGVTVVGVLPTHRRRRVLTEMMRTQLEDIRDRGEPIAALWASEEVIYRRFGYGLASAMGEMELARGYSALREPPDPAARGRLITLEEARELVPPIYDRVRVRTPGMFERTKEWWELRNLDDPPERREGGGVKNAVLMEIDGEPAGYGLYRLNMKWEAGASIGHIEVIEAIADGTVATQELWRLLLEMDWMASIRAYLLPADHPLFHMLRYPRRMKMRVSDGLWVRLVDVGAALSARTYASAEPVVFEVDDPFLPDNSGRWRLADAEASRTDGAADLALDVGELGAAYLGGFTFGELVRAGRVTELNDGAAWRADAVFRSEPKPWCPEIF
jgi:predicted acetyltransferase